jgi:membrane protein
MPRARLQPLLDWLRRIVSQPLHELDQWQRLARFGYDLSRVGARQLREDRAQQMAGALAFFTLFGLLPVVVVGTVLARALMGPSELQTFVSTTIQKVTEQLGVSEAMVSGAPAPGGEAHAQTLGSFIEELVRPVLDLNFNALGWSGVIVVIISAISLMVTIEKSFNTIARAPEGRPWLWRVTVYWTLLTISPAAIAGTLYVDAWFARWVESVHTWQWLFATASILWSFAVVSLFLTIVYKLVPNTSLGLRPVVIGAVVAAILLEIGKRTLGAYLDTIAVNLLYRSLGLIPLFMLWLYLMWLVVLFGLEVATTLHRLAGRRLEDIEPAPADDLVDPAATLAVMEVAAERFVSAQTASVAHIAAATGLPARAVERMIGALVDAGFLHRLHGAETLVSLARPPEGIAAADVVEVGFRMADRGAERRDSFLNRLRDAQRALAASTTLAQILGPAAGRKPAATPDG